MSRFAALHACCEFLAKPRGILQVTAEVQPKEGLRPLPKSLPMSATRVIMHQIVLPSEVDLMGICFGGQVLQRLFSLPC